MYNIKKLLCLILAVSTILSCLCTVANAEEAENVLLIAPAPDSATADATEETVTDDPAKEETVDSTVENVVETPGFETVSDEEALATMDFVANTMLEYANKEEIISKFKEIKGDKFNDSTIEKTYTTLVEMDLIVA